MADVLVVFFIELLCILIPNFRLQHFLKPTTPDCKTVNSVRLPRSRVAVRCSLWILPWRHCSTNTSTKMRLCADPARSGRELRRLWKTIRRENADVANHLRSQTKTATSVVLARRSEPGRFEKLNTVLVVNKTVSRNPTVHFFAARERCGGVQHLQRQQEQLDRERHSSAMLAMQEIWLVKT